MSDINSPDDYSRIHALIQGKRSLRLFYEEIYRKYAACLSRAPREGICVEIGSGAGFAREKIPGLIATDILPYPGMDQIVDATQMPFENGSVRAIFMLNAFHHIPDAGAFLKEAARCLMPGGRIFLVEPHPGWIASPILRYAHHEPFEPNAKEWKFATTGPLSGANGALAWIVFRRDLAKFESEFPELRLLSYQPHSPLRYWLAGGLKRWSLLPAGLFGFFSWWDRALVRVWPELGSFADIEIERV